VHLVHFVPRPNPKPVGMDSLEATSHPFVIRIWLEESIEEAHRATWRGHITHVPSGERRYLQDLDDMTAFIAPYLERMDIKLSLWWRLRQWTRRWKHRLFLSSFTSGSKPGQPTMNVGVGLNMCRPERGPHSSGSTNYHPSSPRTSASPSHGEGGGGIA
jgi:hypothetical protein